ncbi:MAG: DUF5688 family protein [Lachnospiraceae bacterium]|nr:DUF5688 family protein [Lachnospiraceae bacterium]
MNTNVTEIMENVKGRLGNGYEVKPIVVNKNNGVKLDALDVKERSSNISQVVYIDNNTNIDRIMEALNTAKPSFDMEFFTDYSKVKEKLGVSLSSNPQPGVVKEIAFADIYMTAYVNVKDNPTDGIVRIKDEHLKFWGIDSKQLFEDALENAKQTEKISIVGLFEMVTGLTGNDYIPEDDNPLSDLKIYTNESRTYGASVILYCDLPRECYVIPSSIHEVIVLSAEGLSEEDCIELTNMVRYVNATEVDAVDVLSNHAYHYIDGEFEILD